MSADASSWLFDAGNDYPHLTEPKPYLADIIATTFVNSNI